MKNTRRVCITSDQHFWHKNILKFQLESGSRPFADVAEMNKELIDRHNSVVGEDDIVWYLGDFGFCNVNQTIDILRQLNGEKHYIFGNHDKQMYDPRVAEHFETMQHYKEIYSGKTKIVLFHFPIWSWNREHHGALHFYGHTHNSIPYVQKGLSKDVGADANMCYPFVVDDLVEDLRLEREKLNLETFRNARNRVSDGQ